MEQVVGIVEDALAEYRLVGSGGLGVDLLHIVEYGIHRGADLLYHILHETVLRVLHLLHFCLLDGQLLLHLAQFAEVAQQTEVFHDVALFVV